jgi:hypothetical protein
MPLSDRPSWRSLTAELDVTGGAPRQLLAETFPFLRDVQMGYRDAVGPIRVPAGPANPGTIGTAFDVWMQLQAIARPHLELASRGAHGAGRQVSVAFEQLMDRLGPHEETYHRQLPDTWTGPSAGLDDWDLLRLAWAAALMVEVFRCGMVMPGSPLTTLPTSSPDDLLALAPAAAVDELSDLVDLARERLLPRVHALTNQGPTWLGPVFAGSRRMPADADVVVGHTLLELKTVLGRKTATGRKAALDGLTLYQLLGYVLHDHDDAHEITSVALYQARYGHLAVWRLDQLLHDLADRQVDLQTLRRRWALMLETGDVPSLQPSVNPLAHRGDAERRDARRLRPPPMSAGSTRVDQGVTCCQRCRARTGPASMSAHRR